MLEKISFLESAIRAAKLETKTKKASKSSLGVRILLAHLIKASNVEYDKLCRVAFLEGVAGVPKGSMIKLPANVALSKLKKAFSGEPKISPEWFENKDTGMFKYITSNLGSILKTQTLLKEPLEIINTAIITTTEKSPFYSAGEKSAEAVLNGASPKESASKGLVLFLKRKALNDLRSKTTEQRRFVSPRENDDGEEENMLENIGDSSEEFDEMATGLSGILMDRTNPLRMDVLQIIKDAGLGHEGLQTVADAILQALIKENRIPNAKQIHEYYNKNTKEISVGAFLKVLQKYWAVLYQMVKKDQHLQKMLKDNIDGYTEFKPFTREKSERGKDEEGRRLRKNMDKPTFDSFDRDKLKPVLENFDKFLDRNKGDRWLSEVEEF